MKPIKSVDDPRYVKAMSHPLRVRILAMLDERKASPNQLSGWLGATLGTVAYHVRTLQEYGLVELVDETRVRGAVEHHYRSKKRPRAPVDGGAVGRQVDEPGARGGGLGTLLASARASAAAGGFDRADARLARKIVKLDEKGFAQLSKACEKLVAEAEKIEAAAAQRIAKNAKQEPVVEAGIGVMLFEASRLSGE